MVSIIIPVYNCIKSLAHCVNSVLQQTYTAFEVILVDDGTTDHSGVLCDRIAEKDARIRVIHKSNGGVSSARNAGIDAATGEYITFCDSDDYLDKPNKTNNLSCVLKVSNAKYSLLLTGDIESGEERELVSRHGNELQSDILIVPHHGSKTSSSWPFLFSVKPRIAVFQAGYLNRYRHPHVQVTDRYDLIETTSYRTDRDGAILFWMRDDLPEPSYRPIRTRI